MPERNPRSRRLPVTSTGRKIRLSNPTSSPHRRNSTSSRRAKPRKPVKILSRSDSEPILWAVKFVGGSEGGLGNGGSSGIGNSLFLPRLHTWTDVYSPSLLRPPRCFSPRNFLEEAKVVVSVTVEGSPGPVRAMVKLGASVEEAIGLVVDRYSMEGRSPRLDLEATNSFQLHHSHFSLQSLSKTDKIGEVGGRSFYLRKSCGSNSNCNSFSDLTTGGSGIKVLNGSTEAVGAPADLLFSFIARRLSKIRRRTRKLWKVVICITCG